MYQSKSRITTDIACQMVNNSSASYVLLSSFASPGNCPRSFSISDIHVHLYEVGSHKRSSSISSDNGVVPTEKKTKSGCIFTPLAHLQIRQNAGLMMSSISLFSPYVPCPSSQVIPLYGCLCVCSSFSCMETDMVNGGTSDISSCKLCNLHVFLPFQHYLHVYTYELHVYRTFSTNKARQMLRIEFPSKILQQKYMNFSTYNSF